MKTISKRFLKGGLALLLAFVMLFGTTLTGFAAVLDNAETKANITGITAVYLAGSHQSWNGADNNWKLSTTDNNMYKGTFYVPYSQSNYEIKYVMTVNGSQKWYSIGGYWFTGSNHTFSNIGIGTDRNNDQVQNISTDSGYNKWDVVIYGSYSSNSYVSIKQSAVSALSGNVNATSTSVNSGSTVTLTPSITGGSGSYSYSYSTNGGKLSTTSGSKTVFTAPSVTSNTKYTITTVVKDTKCPNLTKTLTTEITVKPAGYSYTVSAGDGGTITSATSGTATSATITAKANDGYTFDKWTVTGGTVANANSASTTFTITANNAKAVASFKKNAYTVKYDVNGGSGTFADQTKNHGEDITLHADAPTPPAKHIFSGWSDGNGKVYQAGDTYSADANVTLTAQYEKNVFTATFVDYDGTELSTQEINKGETPESPQPTRLGYRFDGWTPEVGPMTSDKTFTATYSVIEYVVSFDSDGGTKIEDIPYTVDESVDSFQTPEKTGYTFVKWVDAGGNECSSIPVGSTGDVALKAVYEIKKYTITVSKSIPEGGTITINGDVRDTITVEHGQQVTIEATHNKGYDFRGFQRKGYSNVDYNNPLIITPDKDADYTVNFVKVWDVEVIVPDSMKSVALNENQGISTTTTHTYVVNDGTVCNITGEAEEGYRLVGWKITQNGVEETINATTTSVTINTNTKVEPIVLKLYTASVSGASAEGTGEYAAGESVTLSFEVPVDKYIQSVTIDPAMPLEVDINKSTGEVSFVMPESDVTLTPVLGDKYLVTFSADVFTSTTNKGYYAPGEDVTIKVTPKGGHMITSITSNQTDVTYNSSTKEITFIMPASNVTLDVTYEASFKAYSEVVTVHIDNPVHDYDSTVAGGTVTMTCNGATLANGGFADGDITYTAQAKTDYTFVGFYSDYYCNKLLSTESTYTVSPESDTTVYALFARKQYIRLGTYSFYEMKFDPNTKAYTMVYTLGGATAVGTASITQALFNNGFDFDVHYDKNAGTHAYKDWGDASFTVDMNKNSSNRTISWGKNRWKVSGSLANTTFPLTITVKPYNVRTYNSVDVSAKVQKNGMDVILSSGRYKVGDANTTITTEGITGTHVTPGLHNGDKEEYKKIYVSEAKTISWELEVGADNYSDFTADMAAGTYVETFVLYKMQSKTFELIEPVALGNNKYQGTAIVSEDSYIVPVFFHTEEYCTTNKLVSIDLYFDASAIQHLNWGPFVSAYAWSSKNVAYLGEWPGQLLIPSEDGKSFYTQLDVPAAGSADPAAGITFSNYLFNTCPTLEQGLFGLGEQTIQTYDYREAITLYEAGYTAITFVAKGSEDGYHGDSNDGSNVSNTVTTTTTGIKDKYTFDYLYCRDGVSPMDFTGKSVADTADVKDITMADYYVVAKGDVIYKSGNYSADPTYKGEWSVDWYIYDSNGNYITKVISDSLWHDLDTTDDIHQTVLMTALSLTPETAAGKTVAISYEAANNCPKVNGHNDGHQLAYDGQWYGNMLDDKVNGQVIVGLDDGNGNFTIETDDTLNDGIYGEGYLKDLEGELHQSLDIKLDYGIADLTAAPKTGYRFLGWYTMKSDGTYVQISKAPTYSTYINMTETYYAIFREIGEKEVVINHRKYVNDDPTIESHNGVGELSVEVKDSDGNVIATSPINTSSSTATFEAVEGKTYTIKIITTPLMKGKFFAWYTDSYRADGTQTYEEVLTEPQHIDSTTKVEATFEFTYDSTNPDFKNIVNIYSDIKRVSNVAKLVYRYQNRFGQVRYYTVNNVPLTDEECLEGFVGNNSTPYCPAYRTLVTFMKNGTEYSYYFPEETVDERIKEYEKEGFTFVSSYNKIQAYAPNPDVTEAFDQQITWKIEEHLIGAEESKVTLTADQGQLQYTVNYTMAGTIGSQPGYYNDLIQITAPPTFENNKFSYWLDEDTNEILCYTTYYNYRIVENKKIKAVYGETVGEDVWTPSINSVTYTREFGDDGDYIYNDFLLAYSNSAGKVLNDVKDNEQIEYGLLVFRDSNYFINEDNKDNITYPDARNPEIETYLKGVAGDKKRNMAFTVGDIKYNCYYYKLNDANTTNFNRLNYFVRYDNNKVISDHYYREYAFTAVAYIIVKGEVYLSAPKTVNFYELGNEAVTTN